jgi:hypothetical protein
MLCTERKICLTFLFVARVLYMVKQNFFNLLFQAIISNCINDLTVNCYENHASIFTVIVFNCQKSLHQKHDQK